MDEIVYVELEKTLWAAYVDWCAENKLLPKYDSFRIFLDDHDKV